MLYHNMKATLYQLLSIRFHTQTKRGRLSLSRLYDDKTICLAENLDEQDMHT